MAKYVETTHSQKTVGAYLKVIKALEDLQALGEDVGFDFYRTQLNGLTGSIALDATTGKWSFVQA